LEKYLMFPVKELMFSVKIAWENALENA